MFRCGEKGYTFVNAISLALAAAVSEGMVDAFVVAHTLLARLLRLVPPAQLVTLMKIVMGQDGINLYLRL